MAINRGGPGGPESLVKIKMDVRSFQPTPRLPFRVGGLGKEGGEGAGLFFLFGGGAPPSAQLPQMMNSFQPRAGGGKKKTRFVFLPEKQKKNRFPKIPPGFGKLFPGWGPTASFCLLLLVVWEFGFGGDWFVFRFFKKAGSSPPFAFFHQHPFLVCCFVVCVTREREIGGFFKPKKKTGPEIPKSIKRQKKKGEKKGKNSTRWGPRGHQTCQFWQCLRRGAGDILNKKGVSEKGKKTGVRFFFFSPRQGGGAHFFSIGKRGLCWGGHPLGLGAKKPAFSGPQGAEKKKRKKRKGGGGRGLLKFF